MGHAATTIMPVATEVTQAAQDRDEDKDLVSRYLAGNMVAFDELMTRHQRAV